MLVFKAYLVDAFNPFEKNARQKGNLPVFSGWKLKKMKPPSSYESVMHDKPYHWLVLVGFERSINNMNLLAGPPSYITTPTHLHLLRPGPGTWATRSWSRWVFRTFGLYSLGRWASRGLGPNAQPTGFGPARHGTYPTPSKVWGICMYVLYMSYQIWCIPNKCWFGSPETNKNNGPSSREGAPQQAFSSAHSEAVHSVALWTRVTLQIWTCVKYVPKQSVP